MKLYLIFLCFFSVLSATASDIRGLSTHQIEDLNTCLEKRGLNFNEINQWTNQIDRASNIDQDKPLFHNFNVDAYDNKVGGSIFDNGIFVSGLFVVRGHHSFKNAIISNMTFVGDYSDLDFDGACLVNVRFYRGNIFDVMKIKYMAEYSKNISSN